MEESASEALVIGVNVFVFIIALTASILLMTNVLNMVNFANESAVKGMSGTLADSVGVVEDRLVSGSDLITYYRRYKLTTNTDIESENYGKTNSDTEYLVKGSDIGDEVSLIRYIEKEPFANYYARNFELIYKGTRYDTTLEKQVNQYLFVIQQEEKTE